MQCDITQNMLDTSCWEDDPFYQSLLGKSLPSDAPCCVHSSLQTIAACVVHWPGPLSEKLFWVYNYALDQFYRPNRNPLLSCYLSFCDMIIFAWRHGSECVYDQFGHGTPDRWIQGWRYCGIDLMGVSIRRMHSIEAQAGRYFYGLPFEKLLLGFLRLFFCKNLHHFLMILAVSYEGTSCIETHFAIYLTVHPPNMPLAIWRR